MVGEVRSSLTRTESSDESQKVALCVFGARCMRFLVVFRVGDVRCGGPRSTAARVRRNRKGELSNNSTYCLHTCTNST